jgi:ribose 5-phosphate isomerase B
MKTVLFVCAGNVCRSPMAEGLLRHQLRNRPGFRVASAGLGAMDGQPVTDASVRAMAEIGVDISRHRSQSLRAPLVAQADYIFTMTESQRDTIQALYPAAAEKTFTVREFMDPDADGRDIADPIGMPLDVYCLTRDQIREAIPSIMNFIDQAAAATKRQAADNAVAPARKPLRVAIAADHGGVEMKAALKDWLAQQGVPYADFGTHSGDAVDYPDYAYVIAQELLAGNFDRGVLICKSGIGMSIAANRYPGIRAALVNDEKWARMSRSHNDSNVLVLSAEAEGMTNALAAQVLAAWLEAEFEGGRHQRRVTFEQHIGIDQVGAMKYLGNAGAALDE